MDGLYGNNEIIGKGIVTHYKVAFFYVSKEDDETAYHLRLKGGHYDLDFFACPCMLSAT